MRQKKKAPFASALPCQAPPLSLHPPLSPSLSLFSPACSPFFSVCVFRKTFVKHWIYERIKLCFVKQLSGIIYGQLTPAPPLAHASAPATATALQLPHSPCQMPNGALVYVIAAPSCASRVYLWTLLMALLPLGEWRCTRVCVCERGRECSTAHPLRSWTRSGSAAVASDYLQILLFN